ncbi:NADP-dependent oxidoreductase domain-containing protein [Dactylonectria estremocensis]|uniref:NADP-dependent oxidoreductase domain-containing protein n=1 Tax=Dactylonectria estremocensis TaxID=1079267 RepID=A0A9P9DS81_9HYPO|nr:NADP-dependent oxidoreductase domain-containing protein [Dactylonectria estremocensis]
MSTLKDPKPVAISVGTHAWRPDDEKIDKIVAILKKHNVKNLDTVFAYSQGLSEQSLGKRNLAAQFAIDTKADTAIIPGSGRFILAFTKKSLEGLQTAKIEIPQKLYKEGSFEKLGISNFTKDQVLDIYNAAKSKDYVLPAVYQSSYSLIVRRNETELSPTLKELGFSLQAYSPMGNGFLAKRPEYIEQVRFHSVLDSSLRDKMIISSATTEQVEESVVELGKGPLEPWVVKRIDEPWEIVKDHAPVDTLGSARKVARTATYNAKFLDTNRTSDNA